MTAYTITYAKTNPTWTDLDKLNADDGHYQRKARPEWLLAARAASDRAQKELDEFHEVNGASTEWSNDQFAEFERILNARNATLEWEQDCIEIASRGEIPASILYTVRMREEAR